MRFPAFLCLFIGVAFAQTTDEKPKLDPEIASLLDAARAVEPEFTADILYRVLNSDRVPEQELREELMEELFELGPRVKHPLRVRSVSRNVDTVSGKLQMALQTGLDGLSLQCRAVQMLLKSDPQHARSLFERIPPPGSEPVRCTDAAVPQSSIYYQTAVAGFLHWFTDEERQKGAHIRFLLDRIQRIESPTALSDAVALVVDTDVAPAEREELIAAYVGVFGQLNDSYREMEQSASDLMESTFKIVGRAREHRTPEEPIFSTVRAYFVRRLTGDVCAVRDESKRIVSLGQNAIGKLVELGARGDVQMFPPLTESETTPAEVLGFPELHPFWSTPAAKDLLARARNLRFGGGETYLSLEVRQTPEWQHEAHQFMLDLDSWDGQAGDNPIEHFHLKAGLHNGLLDLVPAGPLKEQALRSQLSFMTSSPMQAQDPVRLLWQLQILMDLARKMSKEPEDQLKRRQGDGYQIPGLPGDSSDLILETMRGSHNAVIALYGNAERVLPLNHGKWIP